MAEKKLHIYLKSFARRFNRCILSFRSIPRSFIPSAVLSDDYIAVRFIPHLIGKRRLRLIDRVIRTSFVSGAVLLTDLRIPSPAVTFIDHRVQEITTRQWAAPIRLFLLLISLLFIPPILAEPQLTQNISGMMHAATQTSDAAILSAEANVRSIQSPPKALLFISFSMPDGLIESIARDAKRYQIPLVIRGLIDNNFQKTMARLFLIEKKMNVSILIDPLWFKTFRITRVPALVLMVEDQACKAGRPCENDRFEVFYGSLALTEKLQLIADQSTIASHTANAILSSVVKVQSW